MRNDPRNARQRCDTYDYLSEKRGGGGPGSGGDGVGGPGGTGVGGAEENGEKEDAGEGEEEGQREAHPPRSLLPPPLERRPALVHERPPPHRVARGRPRDSAALTAPARRTGRGGAAPRSETLRAQAPRFFTGFPSSRALRSPPRCGRQRRDSSPSTRRRGVPCLTALRL
jgi:hypothetical protein